MAPSPVAIRTAPILGNAGGKPLTDRPTPAERNELPPGRYPVTDPLLPRSEREQTDESLRLERDRDHVGSGLGLSLVAAVMRLHRATIELLDNRPGLLVRCVLPLGKGNKIRQAGPLPSGSRPEGAA